MAKGQTGFALEGWKFVVYLAIPLGASWYYNDPHRQQSAIDYWRFIQYPPTDAERTLKDDLAKARQQQEQRQAYREQLQELQRQAQQSRAKNDAVEANNRRWWKFWGNNSNDSP